MAWLYKQAGSKYWWIGYRQNGRQFLRSTKKEVKADAEKVLATFNSMRSAHQAGALTQEFYHALTNTPNVRRPLQAAINEWLEACKASTAEDTYERYNDVAKSFLEHFKATEAAPVCQDITTADVQAFLVAVRSRGGAVTTANLYRTIVAMFFRWCVEMTYVPRSPALPVKKFKASQREKKSRRPFTLTEINTMYSVAPEGFWRYMILGGFFTGLRMGDLICATWANFDFSANMLRLTTAKTGETVNVPLSPRFKAEVLAHRKDAGRVKGADHLWPEQARRYQEQGAGQFSNEFYDDVMLPAGLVTKRTKKKKKQGRSAARVATSVSFHCLRHTFVSTLKLTGAHQSTAKELAGHASDEVNDIYTHTPEPVLIEAVSKLDDALRNEPKATL